ncbi:MAG: saccharopine dehydrogenase NADP-binding domain-containing protein [Armatimonadetes bacterium]|nr:saccharopine dehydrogenase NADP-binding domain-containing protein [Armatimonadota bacterium]
MNIVVVGAGRQGPAAAYDLATRQPGSRVTVADYDLQVAQKTAQNLNSLQSTTEVLAAEVDATDTGRLASFLTGYDLAVAAAPYRINPNICHAGIEAGCHVADMGVDTPDARAIHAKSERAKEQGICIVTDCGIAPGSVNILAMALLQRQPDTTSVRLYCGGLPTHAGPPFFHKVEFSVESLLGEYVDEVDSLRNGQIVRSQPLEDLETLEFAGVGILEAATTSGGTGTAPYALQGQLDTYEYKTLRYPGHWSAMRFLRDAGFWEGEALKTTLEIMERHMVDPAAKDIVVARVEASGPSGTSGYDLIDRHDPGTGFTAMQRTTGFSTAIVAAQILYGSIEPGCKGCEEATEPLSFIQALRDRGIEVRETQRGVEEFSHTGTLTTPGASNIS